MPLNLTQRAFKCDNVGVESVFLKHVTSFLVVGFNFVDSIRAGISMWPNVPIGRVSRPFCSTFYQLDCQRRRGEDLWLAVGLRELTEGRRVRDVIVKEVLDELLAASARCPQLAFQLRDELFHILHHRGAYTKQAQEENQASTDTRDKVESHLFWKTWKGGKLKLENARIRRIQLTTITPNKGQNHLKFTSRQ